MLDSIASKRRSRRCSLWLAPLITAAPLASPLYADPPLRQPDRGVPKRLPTVAVEQPGKTSFTQSDATDPQVQTCSAEFDQLVESWFSEATETEASTTPSRWLRSTSSSAAAEVARRFVSQATREFEVGAWLSAETSAWNAVRWASESIDLAARERGENDSPTALQNLQIARDAIREARDFSGLYGPPDEDAIQRMARSHQTDVLDNAPINGLTGTDASDRYLDHARVALAPIARQSIEAAQGMDLLAAIYLGRADATTLPSSTALSLRRAALQGQPGNASLASRLGMHLADLGLLDEARWALEHSLAIEDDPATATALAQVLRRSGQHDQAARLLANVNHQLNGPSRLATGQSVGGDSTSASGSQIRVPQIVELSPQEFASISQPVIPFKGTDHSVPAATVSATIESDDHQEEQPGVIRRFFGSFKRIW